MRGQYKFLAFLSNLNIGISAPVLSLMICEHGCSLENIGLVIVAFSTTVVVLEIPSGIFADLYGRKSSFLLSQIAGIFSAGVLVISESFVMTTIGLVFMGISTAFASGSLDALAVEDAIKRNGEAAMSKAVLALQVCGCGGVACGAFLGGFLPYTDGYLFHLLLKVILGFIAVIFAVRLPKEERNNKQSQSLNTPINEMWRVFKCSNVLKWLAVCTGISGNSVWMFPYWKIKVQSKPIYLFCFWLWNFSGCSSIILGDGYDFVFSHLHSSLFVDWDGICSRADDY